jgi:hypothetical protein
MTRKLFGIASIRTFVLAVLVTPLFALAATPPGPLPEPPDAGGGPDPWKPGGDYEEYVWFPGDPDWLECERVGGEDYPYSVRIGTGSAQEPIGLEPKVYGNTISVEDIWELGGMEPVAFDWSSNPYPIVIVKSGRASAVYYYEDEPTFHDEGLTAIEPWEPSHLTFCWGEGDVPPGSCETEDETAWGDGYPYNVDEQGNWATYTPYPVVIDGVEYDGVVWAGQHMDAGTLVFSEVEADDGTVTVTAEIWLHNVWRFARVEENVKIQPYYDEPPPDGNPVPGDFEYKYDAKLSPFRAVGLPKADYYGVHLDLEWEACE